MSGDTRRMHLRFSMLKQDHIDAYDALTSIPSGQRMEYLCGLINQDARLLNMERRITNAVRKALQDFQPQALPQKEESEMEEIRDDVMDFLNSL